LGVSDYKSYVQNLDNQQQIVVEIWGIADLDQAKDIIWKTVELEFRLPNKEDPNQTMVADRKAKAQILLQQINSNPQIMPNLADWRWAENIFYNYFSWITLDQLPDIYQKNPKVN
jgi:hypothetical protein